MQSVNRLMLDNEHDLMELLQAPELMDQCVKNGLYEEALDLHDYIHSLCQGHPDIPILVGHSVAAFIMHATYCYRSMLFILVQYRKFYARYHQHNFIRVACGKLHSHSVFFLFECSV